MSRRFPRVIVNRHADGSRASIGDTDVAAACSKLDQAVSKECALLCQGFDVKQVIPMLFPDDVVELLVASRIYFDTYSPTGSYPWDTNAALYVDLNFEGVIPTPSASAFRPNPTRYADFLYTINQATKIREKYAAVKHLLRWFNRNATPAAVRALWPAVLTLCPGSALCKEYAEMPSRYVAPDQTGELLALIRDTAATVAHMQMLPSDVVSRTRGTVRLTFTMAVFIREQIDIHADAIVVNL